MDLEQKAIERIRAASEMSLHYYGKPLVCTYSGAPQTVYHIREVFRDLELQGIKCSIDYHRQKDGSYLTMWKLIKMKLIPPMRTKRYCCSVLKETAGRGRMIATGVRWAESSGRKEMGDV